MAGDTRLVDRLERTDVGPQTTSGGQLLINVLSLAALVEGVGLVYLGGRDGSYPWQVGRVAVTVTLTVVAIVGLQRRSLAGAIAYLLGAFGVSVGLGIGVMHLLTSSDWMVTLAGLLSLAAGAVLLVLGVHGLVLLVRGWLRLVVGFFSVFVAFVLVFPSWQAFYATNVPHLPVGNQTPADFGVSFRDVEFASSDGVVLSGWYIPTRNGAAVVLLHGAGSTRSAVLRHAVVLAHRGYGVLLYDARGHGRSGGRAMDFGWYGDEDVEGAVSYLIARPGVDSDQIAAVGLSMGGEEAIGAAAADRRIHAVVAEGATGRTAADDAWLSERYGIRGSLTEAWKTILEYDLADLLTDAGPPASLRGAVALAAPRPVLLIVAGDVEEEAAAAGYIRSGSPGTVRVWRVPGTDHVQALATHPSAWEHRVVGFLDQALTPES